MDTDTKEAPNRASAVREQYDRHVLLDYDTEFIQPEHLEEFAEALKAPDYAAVTALNDWRPIHQKVRKLRRRKTPKRRTDETREGFVYSILHYPLLFLVFGWIVILFFAYNLTRIYIYAYEHIFSWRGRRQRYRRQLQQTSSYDEWCKAAIQLDAYLGNDSWKIQSDYAYYDSKTVQLATVQIRELREKAEAEALGGSAGIGGMKPIDELKLLLQSCIKNNFVGVENPRLYCETYLGTKDSVQEFIDQVEISLKLILESKQITAQDKTAFFKHIELNYGRTALCLSGGATFAYYHFGVIKALVDTDNLPEIVTGTSGGALVAALVCTRTDEELKQLLVPALAHRIKAAQDPITTWLPRWWRTGARFDSIDWARKCSWFCRGSLTFREAYERTGRILNVTCIPSDPHSPTILNNYLTSPDCVIWTAVLASAAVPGIINPVVLMQKNRDGQLEPYSFGHKWKDGSLRTDIPLKALNLHFNVNFSIVSQVNPHINLFFFSPRGSPGRPVTHRKGRGWRGGFLGSTLETSIKLDLQKYLKILRHLELLPRPMGQDWSEIWLQRFSGTITIWPKSILMDFFNILSDPTPSTLARMIRVGERSCWPRIRFIANRMKVERIMLDGLRRASPSVLPAGKTGEALAANNYMQEQPYAEATLESNSRPRSLRKSPYQSDHESEDPRHLRHSRRQSGILEELSRQASVLWNNDGEYHGGGGEDGASTTDDDGDEEEEGDGFLNMASAKEVTGRAVR